MIRRIGKKVRPMTFSSLRLNTDLPEEDWGTEKKKVRNRLLVLLLLLSVLSLIIAVLATLLRP